MSPWTSPRTWSVGEILSAANLNTYVSDNLAYLKASPSFDGGTTHGAGFTAQFPSAAITIPATAHATSRRALFQFDDWQFMQDFNGNGTKDFALYQVSASLRRFIIDTSGNIGIGQGTPKGRLHVAETAANMLFVEKSGITGTTSVLAAGAVTKRLTARGVIDDGSSTNTMDGSGGISSNIDVGVGTSTFRIAINANGSVDFVRSAGAGTLRGGILLIWI